MNAINSSHFDTDTHSLYQAIDTSLFQAFEIGWLLTSTISRSWLRLFAPLSERLTLTILIAITDQYYTLSMHCYQSSYCDGVLEEIELCRSWIGLEASGLGGFCGIPRKLPLPLAYFIFTYHICYHSTP